jgi:hypothetical protein
LHLKRVVVFHLIKKSARFSVVVFHLIKKRARFACSERALSQSSIKNR